jgi:hypothetical protein
VGGYTQHIQKKEKTCKNCRRALREYRKTLPAYQVKLRECSCCKRIMMIVKKIPGGGWCAACNIRWRNAGCPEDGPPVPNKSEAMRKTWEAMKRPERITVTCACGVKFQVLQTRIDKGRGKYCSMKCVHTYSHRK